MANRKGGKNAKKSKNIRAAYTEKAKKKKKKKEEEPKRTQPKNKHRASATIRTAISNSLKSASKIIKSNVVVNKKENTTPKKTTSGVVTPTTHRNPAFNKPTTTPNKHKASAPAMEGARNSAKAVGNQFGFTKDTFKFKHIDDTSKVVDAHHVGTTQTSKTSITEKDQQVAGDKYVENFFGKDGKSGKGWKGYKEDLKNANQENAREAYKAWYRETHDGKNPTKAEVNEWFYSEEGRSFRKDNYYAMKRGWYKDENGNKVYLRDEKGNKVGSARENIEKALRNQAAADNPLEVQNGRMSTSQFYTYENLARSGMTSGQITKALKNMTGLNTYYDKDGNVVKGVTMNDKGNLVYKGKDGKTHLARTKDGKKATSSYGGETLDAITKQLVYSYTEGQRGATGFMEGANFLPVSASRMSGADLSQADINVIEKGKNSKEFQVGNTVGLMVAMLATGAGGLEDAIAQRLIRNMSKKALAKQGIKATDQDIIKAIEMLRKGEIQSSAITDAVGNVGKLKKYGARAVGGAVSTAYIDMADALRMSTDEDGNINPKALALYSAMNIGMGGGMSSGMKGIGNAVTKAQTVSLKNLGKTADTFANVDQLLPVAQQSNTIDKTAKLENKDIYSPSYNTAQKGLGGINENLAKNIESYKGNKDILYADSRRAKGIRNLREKQANGTITKEERKVLNELNKDSMTTVLTKGDAKELARITSTQEARTLTKEESAKLANLQIKADTTIRNKERYSNVVKSVDAMTQKTGTKYRAVSDAEMRGLIASTGREVSDNEIYKGFYYKNDKGGTEILINADVPQAHQTIIGHETGHLIKSADEDGFKELSDMLFEYVKKNGEYDELFKRMKKSYPEADKEGLDEEMACELLGRYVYGNDDAFIKQLANKNPSVLRKIIDYFKELLAKNVDANINKELDAIIKKTEDLVKKFNDVEAVEGKIGGSQVAMFRFSKESKEAKQFESSLAERLKNGEDVDTLFDDAYNFIKEKTPQSYEEPVENLKELRDARRLMRTTDIRITTTDATKEQSINKLLENVGYDKKTIGSKINLKKNSGISIETAYHRLQEVDSTRFPDLDTEEDMLRKMCDVAQDDIRGKQTIEIPKNEYENMVKQEASDMLERAFAKNQSAKKVEEGLANAKPVSKKAQEESIQTSTEGEKADILRDAKVSDKPVADLSVEELNKEKTSLGFGIKNGKTPEHIELRKQRLAEVESELASRKKPYDKSIYTAPASENLRENTRKAMDYGIDVSDRVNEFNELGDKYDALKKQRDKATNPSEREKIDAEMELAKVRQTNIAESIYKDLADERLKVGKGEDFAPEYFDATAKGETSSALKDIGGAETLAGDMKKVSAKGTGSKKAQKLVAEEMKDYKSCLESYLKGDFAKDADMQNARATAILDNLAEKLKSNPEDADAMADLMKVVDKLSTNNSLPSNVINSANTLMNATPKGRIGVAVRAVNDLNKRYGDRIDGVLKLTDEEQVKLATTEPSEELDTLYKEITARLWEDIPASRLEKFNEIRHMFMLTNARTHARNLGGNFSFKQFRRIADNLEWIMQDKVFRNAIERRGGDIDRVKVTSKEISEHKDYLKAEFETAYTKSNSTNRWIETNRPDGVPIVKTKVLNALIQGDYKALEIEDMLTFKPAFNKSYMQYVKAKGWDIKNMTPPQQKMARERALFDAEYATFRDTSRFSTWLTGKKHTLASREGKTIWGTAFYRMGNMALEGLMPFVKTPVNIFRRSVDFSPISLVRSIGELASKDPEIFKQGIKHLSTGLTGTGVFGLGYYLSNAGFISIDTKTGEHSGSKYYDQDMGYQDYSLVIDIGGKKQSWSIDWLQPIEASLFMGAAFKDMVSDIKAGDGFGTDAIAALFAVTSPMLDASFMSSTKDMLETFEQRTARENDKGEPDMAGAFAQMLLGDLPKNYISSVVPQVVSQVANATDKYQRDTRSTLEDPILASWDKALKQMVNRIPVLRQKLLNPKLDRFGEDKVTGNNVAVRLLNSMFNPSNVKDITENKYDRELFKIRDHIDKGTDDYKYFFYNFTGNPVYELANDKRMTYDELYKYGKANRVKQTEIIQTMIDSKSYGGMTWDMKAKEVDDAHWVANTVADLKTYGVNYTLKALFNNGKQGKAEKGDFESYKAFKGNNKETKKAFLDYYIEKETMLARAHCDTADIYRIKAAIAIRKGDKELLSALDVYKSNIEDMTTYIKQMRKKVKSSGKALKDLIFDDITDFTCSAASYIDKAGVTSSTTTKSLALGLCAANGDKKSEITYRGMGYDWNKAQAGAGLALKYGVNGVKGVGALNELASLKAEIRRLDADSSGSYTKSDVTSYIDSNMSGASDDEKACMFESLSNGDWKNPYKAEINDHLKWKENRDESSGGGGGWGHGWGHGGGGGSSAAKGKTISQKSHKAPKVPKTKSSASVPSVHRTSVNPSAPNFSVTNPFGSSNTSTKSNLDDAYRKKLKKLLG